MSWTVQNLFVLSVLVLFTVSGGMLWFVGYNYDGLTGNAATKIHPGTYLVFLSFALAALQEGNPIRYVVDASGHRPASLFLFTAAAIVLAQTIYRAGPGMAGIVDTYMLPALVVALFSTSDRKLRDRIEIVLHAAMIANALLGLVEFGTKHLYFPYRFDGVVFAMDTRSTALQGHPLGNATVTAIYVLALFAGGGQLPKPLRAGIVVLELMALVAFGGRSAVVTVGVLGAVTGCVVAFRTLRSGRVPLLGMAVVAFAMTVVPLVLIGLSLGGFFDSLLTRFSTDGGSANARVEMLTVVREIPFGDLVIGPDPTLVDSLRRLNGLEEGIENPFVRTLVYHGLIVTSLLTIAVGLFLREVARHCRRGVAMPMIGFLIVINTFESLGSKSTVLGKFAIFILILFPPDQSLRRRPVATVKDGRSSCM